MGTPLGDGVQMGMDGIEELGGEAILVVAEIEDGDVAVIIPIFGGLLFFVLVYVWLTSALWFSTPPASRSESRCPMFLSRRQALVSTGVSVAATTLAGCAANGKPPAEASPASAPMPGTAPAQAQALVKTSDVPVGSGVVVDGTVITQPTAGQFKGFSNVCTHAGCKISEIVDGTINCPCHGSKFNLDGTVAHGPAQRPLDAKAIVVNEGSITLG